MPHPELEDSALVQSFSSETLRTIRTLPLAADDRNNADRIIAAMDTYINGNSGILVHRHDLHTRLRAQESVESFAVDLKDRALRCGYRDCCFDELLRDAFVHTINNREITEKLLQQPRTLTFIQALDIAKAMEGARTFASAITSQQATAGRFQQQQRHPPNKDSKPCGYCGGRQHQSVDQCPARGKTCTKCGKYNHFEKVCRSGDGGTSNSYKKDKRKPFSSRQGGRTNAAQQDSCSEDDSDGGDGVNQAQLLSFTLSAVYPEVAFTHVAGRPDPLRPLQRIIVPLKATNEPNLRANLSFLADSGSNVTCITPAALASMGIKRSRLCCKDSPPQAPALADGQPSKGMQCLGVFRGTFTFGKTRYAEDVYVYKGLRHPLMSRFACFALGILRSDVLEGGNCGQQQA